MAKRKRRWAVAVAATVFGIVAVSCGGEATTVNVELKEFSITPDATSGRSGT